jgi:hypothetical protein
MHGVLKLGGDIDGNAGDERSSAILLKRIELVQLFVVKS